MIEYVDLTGVEKAWATSWATEIYEKSADSNLHDAKMDKSADSLQLDIIGFSGELAFAKMANLFPLTNTDGPTNFDIIVNGKKVDVKTTHRDNGQLLVRPAHKGKSADAFVLLTGTMNNGYTYRGWMNAEEVFQDENLTNLGHGSTYAVPQYLLKKGLPA